MSDKPLDGVTTPNGLVHGCEGLYVIDGAALCTSVGVNPSATITAVAERNVIEFIRAHTKYSLWPAGDASPGAREYAKHWSDSRSWGTGWTVSPPDATQAPPKPFCSAPLGTEFEEGLQGYYDPTPMSHCSSSSGTDDSYLAAETRGRPAYPIDLDLRLRVEDLTSFFEDKTHTMLVTGAISITLPDNHREQQCKVTGEAQLLTARYKPYGARRGTNRFLAQKRLARRYTTRVLPSGHKADSQRFFYYILRFTDGKGRPWTLYGYKRLSENPALQAWRNTSTLFVSLFEGHLTQEDADAATTCSGAGAVHAELAAFLFKQLKTLKITGTDDPARIVWATTAFAHFFFGSLLRIYSPAIGDALGALFGKHRDNVITEPHRPPWRRWGQ